jgi:beta-mannosidase
MESVTVASDRHPQSRVLEHHNKLPEGTERLYRFLASHFLVAGDFEDFVFKAQIVQAEALKTASEHWRRRKFKTAGSMFWQLNDCWPVTSWSVIDSGLRPKAAYYFAKKFYAPLLVSFRQTRDSLEVWGTNDLLLPINGDLRVILRSFEGVESWTKLKPVIIPANSSRLLMRVPNADIAGADSTQNYLHAQLQVSGKDVSENRYFLSEPKHMRPQPSALTTELVKLDDRSYELSIGSKTLVKNARIDFEEEDVVLQDNFFDVDPGVTKRMKIITEMPLEQLQKRLKIRSLWG